MSSRLFGKPTAIFTGKWRRGEAIRRFTMMIMEASGESWMLSFYGSAIGAGMSLTVGTRFYHN